MELSQNPNQQSPRVRLNLNSDIENIENLTPQRFYTSLNTERKNYLSLYKTSVQREVKSVPDFGCLNSNWICLKSSPVKAGGRVSPLSNNHLTVFQPVRKDLGYSPRRWLSDHSSSSSSLSQFHSSSWSKWFRYSSIPPALITQHVLTIWRLNSTQILRTLDIRHFCWRLSLSKHSQPAWRDKWKREIQKENYERLLSYNLMDHCQKDAREL